MKSHLTASIDVLLCSWFYLIVTTCSTVCLLKKISVSACPLSFYATPSESFCRATRVLIFFVPACHSCSCLQPIPALPVSALRHSSAVCWWSQNLTPLQIAWQFYTSAAAGLWPLFVCNGFMWSLLLFMKSSSCHTQATASVITYYCLKHLGFELICSKVC